MDLAIVIDESGSVTKPNFDQAVKDVAKLVKAIYTCNDFQCNEPQVRVALVAFGSFARVVFNFSYSAANHRNRDDIVKAF